jgi:hypothetical protein
MQELHTDNDYGTHHRSVIEELTKHGLYCYVNAESSLEEVIYHVDHHELPVLVHYIEPTSDEGHYSVIIGHDHEHVILHDPWNGPHLTMTKTAFTKRWHDEQLEFPRWMLVASQKPFAIGRQYVPQESKP